MIDPPLRVLHVVQTLAPSYGGPPQVALWLAEVLSTRGCGVSIISWEHSENAHPVDQILKVWGARESVTVHRLLLRRPTDLGWPLVGMQLLKKIVPEVDCVHLHGVWEPRVAVAGRLSLLAGRPYVISPHGSLSAYCLGQKPLKKRVAMALFYRRHLRAAAALHALSRKEAEELERLEVGPPVVTAPVGVFGAEPNGNGPSQDTPACFPSQLPPRFFLALGRIHPIKGLEVLLDGFARYRRAGGDAELVIAGPDGGIEDALRRRAFELGIASAVHFPGVVLGSDKRLLLIRTLALVQLSRHESFGVAILEAMAGGKPVVVSQEADCFDVQGAGAGLVIDRDPSEVEAALMLLGSDPGFASEMGRRGERLASSRSAVVAVGIDRLVEVYAQKITGGNSASTRGTGR